MTQIGTWITIPHLPIIKYINNLFDFVILDMEHGHLDIETIQNILTIQDFSKIFVRIPEYNQVLINQLQDADCRNILVSHIETYVMAQRVYDCSKYKSIEYKKGFRGLSPFTPGNHFGVNMIIENHNCHVGILVEGQGTLPLNFKQICQTDIEFIYIGIYDLAMSMGYDGDKNHIAVQARLEECIYWAKKNNKKIATFAKNVEDAKQLKSMGVDYIAIGNDSNILAEQYTKLYKDFVIDK